MLWLLWSLITVSDSKEDPMFEFNNKKPAKKNNKNVPISETLLVNASSETEILMVNQACQKDLPFVVHLPRKLQSIPLVDVHYSATNDHSYAALVSDSHCACWATPSALLLAMILQNPWRCWISLKLTHWILFKLTTTKKKLKMRGCHQMCQNFSNRKYWTKVIMTLMKMKVFTPKTRGWT